MFCSGSPWIALKRVCRQQVYQWIAISFFTPAVRCGFIKLVFVCVENMAHVTIWDIAGFVQDCMI